MADLILSILIMGLSVNLSGIQQGAVALGSKHHLN
jgi:hypothetical protein